MLVVGGGWFQAPSACQWHWNTCHRCDIEGNRKSRDRTEKFITTSKFVQNILLFLFFFSISVTQKYAVKQQASGLFSQRHSIVSASAWARLLKEPCLGLCRLNMSAFCFSRKPHCTYVRLHTLCVTHLGSSCAAIIESACLGVCSTTPLCISCSVAGLWLAKQLIFFNEVGLRAEERTKGCAAFGVCSLMGHLYSRNLS